MEINVSGNSLDRPQFYKLVSHHLAHETSLNAFIKNREPFALCLHPGDNFPLQFHLLLSIYEAPAWGFCFRSLTALEVQDWKKESPNEVSLCFLPNLPSTMTPYKNNRSLFSCSEFPMKEPHRYDVFLHLPNLTTTTLLSSRLFINALGVFPVSPAHICVY